METKGKCQSCGMPLKADPKGGGTHADGTSSREYCSYCYVPTRSAVSTATRFRPSTFAA